MEANKNEDKRVKKLKKKIREVESYNSFINHRLTKAEEDVKMLLALHREEIATMHMAKRDKR